MEHRLFVPLRMCSAENGLLSGLMNCKTEFGADENDEVSERLAEMVLHHLKQCFSLTAFILRFL
jgi:hypothetical protein